MRKEERLVKGSDFKAVYENGRSFADRFLVLYVLGSEEGSLKLGISVGKRVGGSVVRNRLKRLVREAFRLNRQYICKGSKLVIIVRGAGRDIDFHQLENSFRKLLRRAELWNG